MSFGLTVLIITFYNTRNNIPMAAFDTMFLKLLLKSTIFSLARFHFKINAPAYSYRFWTMWQHLIMDSNLVRLPIHNFISFSCFSIIDLRRNTQARLLILFLTTANHKNALYVILYRFYTARNIFEIKNYIIETWRKQHFV